MSDSARAVAARVILRVADQGAYSTLALSTALERSGLDARDRNLAAELTYGTLRKIVPLDWAIERHTDRLLSSARPETRTALRLGAYQLLFTRIPTHAAVSETVDLVSGRERGFVNAVLRKLAADPPAWPNDGSDESIAIRTGVVAWAVGRRSSPRSVPLPTT